MGNEISSYKVWEDETPKLVTRLDAQLKAEQLFKEFGEKLMKQVNEVWK